MFQFPMFRFFSHACDRMKYATPWWAQVVSSYRRVSLCMLTATTGIFIFYCNQTDSTTMAAMVKNPAETAAVMPSINTSVEHGQPALPLTTNLTASSLTSGGNSCLDEQIERLKRCEYLREGEVKALCLRAREILVDESNVQRVDAPVTVSFCENTWPMPHMWKLIYLRSFSSCYTDMRRHSRAVL